MEYRKLGRTDIQASTLAFGASSLGSVFHPTNECESIQVVRKALELGINYIDTAPWYGQGKSEAVLGKALQGIDRQSYFLATKVGRYEKDPISSMIDFSAERTLASVDESLNRLGVTYVDVIQVHDMEFAPSLDIIINETLPALQKIKEAGKAKYIGLTGYPLHNFRNVLDQSKVAVDTILTYCRYSLNDTVLTEYMPYFKEKGIGVINASPLSMGLLSKRGPPEWHPATQTIKETCQQATLHCKAQGVDISKLAMKFCHSFADVTTTLFSTSSMDNLRTSIDYALGDLLPKEESVLDEIITKYFRPLQNANWEGIEVAQYREAMKSTIHVPTKS